MGLLLNGFLNVYLFYHYYYCILYIVFRVLGWFQVWEGIYNTLLFFMCVWVCEYYIFTFFIFGFCILSIRFYLIRVLLRTCAHPIYDAHSIGKFKICTFKSSFSIYHWFHACKVFYGVFVFVWYWESTLNYLYPFEW